MQLSSLSDNLLCSRWLISDSSCPSCRPIHRYHLVVCSAQRGSRTTSIPRLHHHVSTLRGILRDSDPNCRTSDQLRKRVPWVSIVSVRDELVGRYPNLGIQSCTPTC